MKRALAAGLLAALLLCGCGTAAKHPQGGAETPPATQSLPEESPRIEAFAPLPDGVMPEEPAAEPEEPAAEPDPIDLLLAALSTEEKVGQLFFPRCPAESAAEDVRTYRLGGYVLFGRDFKNKSAEDVVASIAAYQSAADIPLLIGADEEGGTVVRVSSNPALRAEKFPSPQQVYANGGMDAVRADAAEKAALLRSLGVNVNLAPVADVSTDPVDFIYRRAFGQNAEATAEYVRAVTAELSAGGMGSVLKHFPGYGNNVDTHTGIAVDSRPLETFETSDLLPFAAGMDAGGDTTAVLVSHNVVECFDADLPASLSPAVHQYLRQTMGFDGVIMTDDLAMEAVSAYAGDGSVAVMALQAGNDLIITTDYRAQIPAVIAAVEDGRLDIAVIDAACRRVLTWKAALGLL